MKMLSEGMIVQIFCALIFCTGLFGVIVRKNLLIVLMSIELMLNAVNLSFAAYSSQQSDYGGQMAVFFIITVAAAESAVGLGLLIALFRTLRTVDSDEIQILRR